MADLQELISRGRFIFTGAPKRLDVFKSINGKKSTKEIARTLGRRLTSVLQDIEKFRNFELAREKRDKNGNVVKKGGASVYEKSPLVKHVGLTYFQGIAETKRLVKIKQTAKIKRLKLATIHIPSENEILDICKNGEDQLYEFKAAGTEAYKISKKIAAYLHTKKGGIIFYGIDDDGTIIGSDKKRQDFDQTIHNSIRDNIDPAPNISVKERNVMGSKIIIIIIPPWDRKTMYQYTYQGDNRYYIKKGTNIFALKPDEIRKLSRGEYIV